MCGICGWVGPAELGEPEERGRAIALDMASAIAHRGPDGAGTKRVRGSRADGWFGHRRLRVIDLTDAAAQPMTSERSGVALVFNGEIYNFRELRSELAGLGHHVRSSGDTEVVLRAYEAWGPDFVARLDGMFALAVWDGCEGRLLLARDRTGKKPLYYHARDGRLTFASEVKALARMPGLELEPDCEAFGELLTFGYVTAPDTIYRGIAQLPPASILRYTPGDGSADIQRWWSPLPAGAPRRADTALIEDVRRSVGAAVKRRMDADVPVGALLSGGIDSSVVCALMCSHSAGRVRTFSAGLADEPSFDERSHASAVAEHLGTQHTEFAVRADAVSLLDRLVWLHDGPFADSSAVPSYLVCEAARNDVTVVLTGDGGDEVFAGYQRFVAAALARLVRPEIARAALGVLPAPATGGGYHDRSRAARRFLATCSESDEDRYLRWVSVFSAAALERLAVPAPNAASRPFHEAMQEAARLAPIDRLIHANLTTYLPGDLHTKLDRCSMAHGLEARSPLLDTAVIELMASVPAREKVGLLRPKPILRRAFGALLPATVWNRPKHGFGVPMDAWFDGELGDAYCDEVLGRDGRLADWLDAGELGRLWTEHASGAASHGPGLWTLLTFERWLRAIAGPEPLCEPARPEIDAAVCDAP
jgi:asparagine synthase (glutamine-hydrolysing)